MSKIDEATEECGMRPFNVLVLLLAVVTIVDVAAVSAGQNLRELAREQEKQNPGETLILPAPPRDYPRKTIEELAREADVVLMASLARVRSYLSSDESAILTDYSILEPSVVAGHLPVIASSSQGTSVPLILTDWGGETIVEGVRVRGTDYNREPINDGARYLLFLMRSRGGEPGQYEIYNGAIFDISQDRMRPLIRNASDVFKGTVDARLASVVSRVQKAVSAR